jgi:hypothetical protein
MQNASLAAAADPSCASAASRSASTTSARATPRIQQLRLFPISGLKIDRSFVNSLGDAPASMEVVQTILALGRSMAIEAVAEGVETTAQLDLFSPPLEARDMALLLASSR